MKDKDNIKIFIRIAATVLIVAGIILTVDCLFNYFALKTPLVRGDIKVCPEIVPQVFGFWAIFRRLILIIWGMLLYRLAEPLSCKLIK